MPDVRHKCPHVHILPGRTAVVGRRVEARLDGHGSHARRVWYHPRFGRPDGRGGHDPWQYPAEPLRDVAEGGKPGGDENVAGTEQVHLAQRLPVLRGVPHLLPPLVARLVHPAAAILGLDPLVVPRAQRGDQHRRVVRLYGREKQLLPTDARENLIQDLLQRFILCENPYLYADALPGAGEVGVVVSGDRAPHVVGRVE
uniref:Uncharacterized protein n=1 Tax=Triticum urartu TaxID=4572 RepID=A0A8R7TQ49_TRIUA